MQILEAHSLGRGRLSQKQAGSQSWDREQHGAQDRRGVRQKMQVPLVFYNSRVSIWGLSPPRSLHMAKAAGWGRGCCSWSPLQSFHI